MLCQSVSQSSLLFEKDPSPNGDGLSKKVENNRGERGAREGERDDRKRNERLQSRPPR
jgi:hypothetical protein